MKENKPKKTDSSMMRKTAAPLGPVCPYKSKLVDELLASAELESERPDVDIDGVYWKRKKNKQKKK